ncbi:MAG: 50S ribosomal protein L24 [Candidatus Thiothrix putei]|jgi:large subunit ribosomal protein L24|uniref:Large ribosomal subunit protein uL24 n=4 Tax=Thiothrix TaxID=1030 RepID=A0A1H3VQC5_9GAMM|nr:MULTISPECIES: 50S ribosomal protein L24 [Thiothrix]UOG93306.1 MAG: 50S ribosomal protein L24 [Candidatus Thiothrix sulfatifontis]WGZ93771.1 MAG: 50S ribosomal protein L24 [Candidatus Thiothrix putei]MBO0613175.1 50S ribosomal protein L24 [Thiothrix fructosivorans]MDQ5768437.1 50S ribosomal protein L24 [Thiothrix subterranea]QQZ28461.1 50S ribosomal protein L24 [Thiothrix subterranea]
MRKIRSNDEVVVITGKDKGRRGKIMQVLVDEGKVLVQGINRVKKHVKPNPNAGVQGGIIEKEMPMDTSNVMLVNPATGKGDRVGFKLLDDGKKIRVFKSNGERVDA